MDPFQTAPSTACRVHPNHPLELFCVTCDVGICSICLTTAHRRHSIDSLRTVGARNNEESTLRSVAGTFQALASASAENSRLLTSVRSFQADLLSQIGQLVLNAQEHMTSVHRKVAQQELGWRDMLEKQAARMMPECSSVAVVVKNEEYEPAEVRPTEEKQRAIVPFIEMRQCIVNLNSTAEDLCNVVLNYEYGISWNLQFSPRRRDAACEVSISCRTSEECPQFQGNFLLQMDVVRLEDLSVFTIRKSLKGLTMRPFFVIPTPILIDTNELKAKGFLSKAGRMTVRVGIGPEDAQTERTCLLTNHKILQQRNDALQHQMQQASFTVGTLTVPDYHAQSDGQFHSKPIITPAGARWILRLKVNLGAQNANRTHLSVQIVRCDLNPMQVKHEYFVELLHGTRKGFAYRLTGTDLVDDFQEPRFIEKAHLVREYLADGARLEMRWGVRKWCDE